MAEPIGLRFWKGCWIYPKKVEKANMKAIIQVLKKNRSVSTMHLYEMVKDRTGTCCVAFRHSLFILIALKVIRVQQHRDVRVYSLTNGWNFKLSKAIIKFNE